MKPVRAGDIRTPVNLGKPVVTLDDAGGEVITWSELKTWAGFAPVTGREWVGGSVVKDAVDCRITMRYNPEWVPDARWRVVNLEDGKTYDIQSALADMGRGVVECVAKIAMGNVDGR